MEVAFSKENTSKFVICVYIFVTRVNIYCHCIVIVSSYVFDFILCNFAGQSHSTLNINGQISQFYIIFWLSFSWFHIFIRPTVTGMLRGTTLWCLYHRTSAVIEKFSETELCNLHRFASSFIKQDICVRQSFTLKISTQFAFWKNFGLK